MMIGSITGQHGHVHIVELVARETVAMETQARVTVALGVRVVVQLLAFSYKYIKCII